MNEHRIRPPAIAIAIAIAIVAGLIPSAAFAGVGGTYGSPLGPVRIVDEGGVIEGKLVGKSPCGFRKGTVILQGERLDDSITGEVKVCKVGPGCQGAAKGLAMLLITRGGSVISGYVHADTGSCKSPLGDAGVSFRKGGGSGAAKEKAKRKDDGKTASSSGEAAERPGKAKQRAAEKTTKTTAKKGKGRKGRRGRSGHDGRRSGGSSKGEPERGAPEQGEGRAGGGDLDEGEPPVSPGHDARTAAEVMANEGLRLMSESKILEARARFQEAVAKDPAYAEGLNGIGVTYYLTDRYEDAEQHYKRALEANPAFPDAYYNLACLYALRQDKEKAFNYLRISVVNGFVAFDQLDKDPDLNSLHDDPRYEKLKAGQLW